MHFDHIDYSHKYLEDILCIIRKGILQKQAVLNKNRREGLNSQPLVDSFNAIGTTYAVSKTWIGVQKEHEREDNKGREDIYFYLNDDNYTRIFFVEAKRLPKYDSTGEEEYVIGESSKPSGGIQRYKLGNHGDYSLRHNGIIAYVENKSIEEWILNINDKITSEYPNDSLLVPTNFENEYTSTHNYLNQEGEFLMHHFWINLTKN
ncbi:MAG: hypothetical protein PHG27_10815 [Massilibacteroides sp.]|nr:hypothetical protein [Massilibacteroides sp.]MDD4661317.1 hypothetical protein [Massilibacteroides sp.]